MPDGLVAEFDGDKGIGTIRGDDGQDYFFHCIAITGGARTIDEGTEVVFDVVPGHQGRWEAARIRSS